MSSSLLRVKPRLVKRPGVPDLSDECSPDLLGESVILGSDALHNSEAGILDPCRVQANRLVSCEEPNRVPVDADRDHNRAACIGYPDLLMGPVRIVEGVGQQRDEDVAGLKLPENLLLPFDRRCDVLVREEAVEALVLQFPLDLPGQSLVVVGVTQEGCDCHPSVPTFWFTGPSLLRLL